MRPNLDAQSCVLSCPFFDLRILFWIELKYPRSIPFGFQIYFHALFYDSHPTLGEICLEILLWIDYRRTV